MDPLPKVAFGLIGTTLDAGMAEKRWDRWRPTVAMCQHEDLLISRLELLSSARFGRLTELVTEDIRQVSPETEVRHHSIEFRNAWDFEDVYGQLHDFMHGYRFDPEREEYLLHITTGTHVAQICMFLLTESHCFPGQLLQTSPPRRGQPGIAGAYAIIDLDLSRYDRIASRFRQEFADDVSFLKSGIDTRNGEFNRMVDRIEHVALHSTAPMLLTGPTGAGKSLLARRIYELRKAHRDITGDFVEVNCATLRGDNAMSTLFGHVKGAFTGALRDRPGLLRRAHDGVLFLDEVGELGVDEQAMLLRALEEKRFLPLGADRESESDFVLICGTNRDLDEAVREGQFREDLLTRINLWTFCLPGLRERPEDIEPNIDYELKQVALATGVHVRFNKQARAAFAGFATSAEAAWLGNFRDLNAAVTRMATLAPGGRITEEIVREETARLCRSWQRASEGDVGQVDLLIDLLGADAVARLDRFDRVQLADVVAVCRRCRSMSEAGRALFAESRKAKANPNDADRIRKYLARHGLSWADVQGEP